MAQITVEVILRKYNRQIHYTALSESLFYWKHEMFGVDSIDGVNSRQSDAVQGSPTKTTLVDLFPYFGKDYLKVRK